MKADRCQLPRCPFVPEIRGFCRYDWERMSPRLRQDVIRALDSGNADHAASMVRWATERVAHSKKRAKVGTRTVEGYLAAYPLTKSPWTIWLMQRGHLADWGPGRAVSELDAKELAELDPDSLALYEKLTR